MNYASLFHDVILVQSQYKDLFLWIVALLAIFSSFSLVFFGWATVSTIFYWVKK